MDTASVGEVVPFEVIFFAGYKAGSIKLNGRMIKSSSFAMHDKNANIEVSFLQE